MSSAEIKTGIYHDRADIAKMQVLIAQRAQELIPNAIGAGEAMALRIIAGEVLRIAPQDVSAKYTSNAGIVQQNGKFDYAGYATDYTAYYSKGISNSG